MQVLLITVILAGIATMLLRASFSRTTSARHTRRSVSAQILIQACMAEVNSLWAKKTPDAFRRDLKGVGNTNNKPYMYCTGEGEEADVCPTDDIRETYTCTINNPYGGDPYIVEASFVQDTQANGGEMWQIAYEIVQGSENL